MPSRALAWLASLAALTGATGATTTLANDSYAGGAFACSADPGALSSRAAAVAGIPADYPFTIVAIEVLPCGDGPPGGFGVTLYSDAIDGVPDPGPPIYSSAETFILVPDGTLQQIDLSDVQLRVDAGGVRVALTSLDASGVGFGVDLDGITAQHDFVQAAGGGWSFAENLGATGDYVLRLIVEPAPPPAVSISDATVVEGDAGRTAARFKISIPVPTTRPVSVRYRTTAGTATEDVDFQAASGVATIEPGQRTVSVRVAVVGDTEIEPNETFGLALQSFENATVVDRVGKATVVDDDG